MKTGLPQQQPLHNDASVRSAPTQQHGAHIGRSAFPEGARTAAMTDKENTVGPPLKR